MPNQENARWHRLELMWCPALDALLFRGYVRTGVPVTRDAITTNRVGVAALPLGAAVEIDDRQMIRAAILLS